MQINEQEYNKIHKLLSDSLNDNNIEVVSELLSILENCTIKKDHECDLEFIDEGINAYFKCKICGKERD